MPEGSILPELSVLDPGEAEAIALAASSRADVVLLDERQRANLPSMWICTYARMTPDCARRNGLRPTHSALVFPS